MSYAHYRIAVLLSVIVCNCAGASNAARSAARQGTNYFSRMFGQASTRAMSTQSALEKKIYHRAVHALRQGDKGTFEGTVAFVKEKWGVSSPLYQSIRAYEKKAAEEALHAQQQRQQNPKPPFQQRRQEPPFTQEQKKSTYSSPFEGARPKSKSRIMLDVSIYASAITSLASISILLGTAAAKYERSADSKPRADMLADLKQQLQKVRAVLANGASTLDDVKDAADKVRKAYYEGLRKFDRLHEVDVFDNEIADGLRSLHMRLQNLYEAMVESKVSTVKELMARIAVVRQNAEAFIEKNVQTAAPSSEVAPEPGTWWGRIRQGVQSVSLWLRGKS